MTQDELKALLHYDPETGHFTSLVRRKKWRPDGPLGSRDKRERNGYVYIGIDYKTYAAHRLAWLYMTGEWPAQIDHADCNPANNAWENLRLATGSQNLANSRKRVGTTSKFKGVSFDKSRNKWIATIRIDYRKKTLGRYGSEEEAHAAYLAKAREVFGEFARAR